MEPSDVTKAFTGLSNGQRHNLIRGLRNLFNFLEAWGFDREYLDVLRRNIPRDDVGLDVNIPTDEEVITSLKNMSKANPVYNSLYNLVLDSGLRLTEACRLMNTLDSVNIEEHQGFYVAPLGYFRDVNSPTTPSSQSTRSS